MRNGRVCAVGRIADRPGVQQPDQLRGNGCTETKAEFMTFLDRLTADYAAR